MAKHHGTTRSGTRKRRSPRGAGRLYKRSSGKDYPADSRVNAPYWLQYSIPNPAGKGRGKMVRTPLKDATGTAITDKAAAEAERRRIVAPYQTGNAVETLKSMQARLQDAEAQHAQAVDEANPPLRLADAANAYLSSPNRPDSGKLTLDGYFSQWARFADWMAADHHDTLFMRDVTPDQVRGYVAALADLSPSTFNQHVNTLRRFWRVLADEARTDDNPWKRVQHKSVARVERRHRVLTLDEASAIIDAAAGEMKDLLATIALTGQRLVDVAKMQWQSVDLDAGVISLVPTKTRRRNGKMVFIPILPQTRAILDARPQKGKMVFPEMAELFDVDRGATLTKRIRKVVVAAGLDPHEEGTGFVESTDGDGNVVKQHSGQRAIVRVSAHSLRHTFTTIARAAGIPDAVVRSIVGHSTASMTEHYTAFDKAIVQELSNRFQALPAGQHQLAAENAGPLDPLPPWAVELVEKLPNTNAVKPIKAALLKGGAA